MALTFTPPFIQSAFDPPSVEIAATGTSLGTPADGTDILTAGTNGAAFVGMHFKAQEQLPNPTKIVIVHYTGSVREVIGEIIARQDDAPTTESLSWEGTWIDPQFQLTGRPRYLPASDVVECFVFGSTARKITAIPLGGNL